MAARTIAAAPPFVDVVGGVAVVASLPDVAVLAREMALLARHRDVQPEQRIARQVVIEDHAVAPAHGRMTLLALAPELAGVHVIRPVAGEALARQLLRRN